LNFLLVWRLLLDLFLESMLLVWPFVLRLLLRRKVGCRGEEESLDAGRWR